jgi:AraC-like DNA-binding protein
MDEIYKKIHGHAVRFAASRSGLEFYRLHWWHDESRNWPLFPTAVEETHRSQPCTPFKMMHRWLVLAFVKSGTHCYETSSGSFMIEAGELCLMPPGMDYVYSTESAYHKLVVLFDGELLTQTCRVLNLDEPFKARLPHAEAKIRALAALLENESASNTPEILGRAQALLTEISVLNAKDHRNEDYALFLKIKTRLGGSLDARISLEDIAREFGVSRSYIHKLFGRYSSVSPQQYRIDRKMERAKFSLENTGLLVKEIAFQLGYANQHYFSNDFKKHYGLSPRDYRNHFLSTPFWG